MNNEELLKDFLLRAVLRRYAYSSVKAGTGWAEIAHKSSSSPELLRTACDAWEISIGDLSAKAGLEQTVLAQFIMGIREMSWEEHKTVVNAMHDMIGRIDGKGG